MNRILLCLSTFCLFLFIGCTPEDDPVSPSDSINKIMPLGASRVQGAPPSFESYRYELWKQLVDGGWEFDYIGTVDDEASYPNHANQSFDDDHEGRGGWTSGQILNGLQGWIDQTGAPDIVLFSSPGGNDALQNLPYSEAIENVNMIIDVLQEANPNITIIVEQLAPARSELMVGDLANYFDQMQTDVIQIAQDQPTTSSQVLLVDMYTGFDDTYLADDVHYNQAGAEFIADRYYAVLESVLE